MPTLPFEAVIVAALNFGTRLVDLAIEDRKGMDPELIKRFDAVRIEGLERIERILSAIEQIGK